MPSPCVVDLKPLIKIIDVDEGISREEKKHRKYKSRCDVNTRVAYYLCCTKLHATVVCI